MDQIFSPTEVAQKPIAGGGRICFRGDTRSPKQMFRSGFFQQAPRGGFFSRLHVPIVMNALRHNSIPIKAEHKPFYLAAGVKVRPDARTPEAMFPAARDIEPMSAVCVTPRFGMAALFPIKTTESPDSMIHTWIYALYVRNVFNTHAQQTLDGLEAIEREIQARRAILEAPGVAPNVASLNPHVDRALNLLYAQELATESVKSHDVICAIRCERQWNGVSWQDGARYTLDKDSINFNSRVSVDPSITKAVRAFLDKEEVTGETPSRSSGFHRDKPSTRVSVHMQMAAVEERIYGHMDALRPRLPGDLR
ncbi:hypothetical protein [Granulicella arctica]|uniref:hypothetical protein n=1 Tax=Granulicella arctica TaxID=940613 RepID=UPI0021DF7693|nr:hypothetical protein [Granulicella arctica]